MYCEQCGKYNEDGKNYCYNCGAPLIAVQKKKSGTVGSGKTSAPVSSLAGAGKNPSEYTKKEKASEKIRRPEITETAEEIRSAGKEKQPETSETANLQRRETGRRTEKKPAAENSRRRSSGKDHAVQEEESEELKALERELHQLTKSRKPAAALAAAIVVFIVLAVALAVQIPKFYGAEHEAEAFETALLSGNWSEAYSYLDLEGETSDFLTEEVFEQVMARTGASGYRSMTVEEVSSTENQKVYSFSYETGEGQETAAVTMNKTGNKKYLVLNEWKVDLSAAAAANVSIVIPSETQLLLNGLSPESEGISNEEEQTTEYTFEFLFNGIWEAQLTEENRADYSQDIQISEESENGTVSLAGAELYPDQELMDQILAQFTSDYQAILESSVNREDFSAVEQYFTAEAIEEGRAQNMYANACSQAYDPDTGNGIISYELSDIAATFVSTVRSGYAVAGDLVMEVQSTMNYSYYDEGVEKSETSTSKGLLCYHQENGEWKIQSFS